MQQQGRIGRTAPALMARGILGVIALAAGLRFSGSLVIALVWSLVCRNLVFFAYESTFALRGFPPDGPPAPASREWAAQWEILKKALPLGIVLMLNALVLNAPRYFVAASLGERALGIFSAIFSLATAGNLIMNSLGQSATTRLARLHMASDASGFLRLALKMAALGVAIALAGLVCAATIGPWALRLVYRQEYADHASLLVVAMAAAGIGFVATLLGYTITAARRFTQQMPLQLACLAATALASFVLVPRIGLTGAALSVGIGSLVQMLGEAWILRQVLAEMRSVSSRSSQAMMA
jgi:O-antigen/teichoic acid export membrane protein